MKLYKVVMDLSADVRIDLPEDALALLSILDDAGFEAWSVGGFVRDALLGRPCSDIDIACNAMWTDTKRACEQAGLRIHETGVAHGTITVICGDSAFEVTTFRSDGQYKDGRHPDSVTFVSLDRGGSCPQGFHHQRYGMATRPRSGGPLRGRGRYRARRYPCGWRPSPKVRRRCAAHPAGVPFQR